MTRESPLQDNMEVKPSTGLKLRLHLSSSTKKPLTTAENDDSLDDASLFAFQKENSSSKNSSNTNSSTDDAALKVAKTETQDRSLKLTVRLKDSSKQSTNAVATEAPKVTPKIVLQLGKVPPQASGEPEKTDKSSENTIVDIEAVDTKKKEDEGTTVKRRRRSRAKSAAAKDEGSTRPSTAKPAPEAPIRYTTPSYRLPYPAITQNRVPIASTSAPTTTMSAAEREEEMMVRTKLTELYEGMWSPLKKPRTKAFVDPIAELPESALPYWMMLAPIDASMQRTPNVKTSPLSTDTNRQTYILDELDKLRQRLETRSAMERNREICTELVVLEQRLCLEEEKYLFAKLKSEYNSKVAEFIAKKRQAEGLPPTVVSPGQSQTAPAAHQRILPRVPSSTSWSTNEIPSK